MNTLFPIFFLSSPSPLNSHPSRAQTYVTQAKFSASHVYFCSCLLKQKLFPIPSLGGTCVQRALPTQSCRTRSSRCLPKSLCSVILCIMQPSGAPRGCRLIKAQHCEQSRALLLSCQKSSSSGCSCFSNNRNPLFVMEEKKSLCYHLYL